MKTNDREAAHRLDELAWIAARALAAIDPEARVPGDDLPYLRAALQLFAAIESAAAERGIRMRATPPGLSALQESALARRMGRAFDIRLDAIGRDEVEALPSHHIDWD